MVCLLDERRDAGIEVDLRGHGDLGPLAAHGKLLVIDDHTAVIGSMALSTRVLETRRELSLIVRRPGVLRQIDDFWHTLPDRRVIRWKDVTHCQEMRL